MRRKRQSSEDNKFSCKLQRAVFHACAWDVKQPLGWNRRQTRENTFRAICFAQYISNKTDSGTNLLMLLYQISFLHSHTLISNCGKRGCSLGWNVCKSSCHFALLLSAYFSGNRGTTNAKRKKLLIVFYLFSIQRAVHSSESKGETIVSAHGNLNGLKMSKEQERKQKEEQGKTGKPHYSLQLPERRL